MKFEKLSDKHLDQLYKFENENRRWFESLIAPRSNDFYSDQGLRKHINDTVYAMNLGVSFSGVLVNDDAIVARGNLTDISESIAKIGYRVSEEFTSRGYASFCVAELIDIATDLKINTLSALVLENNPASKHILEKFGFIEVNTIANFLTLNKQRLSAQVLQKTCS